MYLILISLHRSHFWLTISITHRETTLKKPKAMPSILFGLRRSALAVLIIFCITGIGSSQNIQVIRTYLHQAFWCSVVEKAVWCPTKVITYFIRSNRRIPPRLLQKLDLFFSFLWSEMTAHIVAESVQTFIAHASLSPSLTEVSTNTSAPKPDPWGTLDQSAILFCVLPIIHSVWLCARCNQSVFESYIDDDFPNVDPKDVPMTLSGVLAAAHGCICHLFGTAGLYIERIATGMLVTSFTISRENLNGPKYWAFTAATGALMVVAHAYVWRMAREWDAQESELMAYRGRRRLVGQQIMLGQMEDRLCMRCLWLLEACFERMVPWRLPRLGRWHCPELAGLWPEGEVKQFYVESLAESSPLALLAPWSHNIRSVDRWLTAGLTRDYVPRDHSAVPVREPTGWLGHLCYVVLGRILMALVCSLEAAFALFFFLALAIAGIIWYDDHKEKLKLKRA